MRLGKDKAEYMREEVRARIPSAKVYLFGSRTSDVRRGGDIDIAVVAPRKLTFLEKSEIRRSFWRKFGEQKIDIVSFETHEHTPFRDVIEEDAIAL